jgi:hypothetical protein
MVGNDMTDIKEEDKYCKGSLSDPDADLVVFKQGKLKDSKPYTNEDGTIALDEQGNKRYPLPIIVTKRIDKNGKNYYPVMMQIGCLWDSKPENKTVVSGYIDIDGEEKSLNVFDNDSYYGLKIIEKDDSTPF